MDKEFVLKLSEKIMLHLNDTEIEKAITDLTYFENAIAELYQLDTSKFANEEEATQMFNILSLTDDN